MTTLDTKFDSDRLEKRDTLLFAFMRDQQWRTLQEMEDEIHFPQASISAGLRSFRRADMGGHTVNRRARGNRKNGLWEYQLVQSQSISPTSTTSSKPTTVKLNQKDIKKAMHDFLIDIKYDIKFEQKLNADKIMEKVNILLDLGI